MNLAKFDGLQQMGKNSDRSFGEFSKIPKIVKNGEKLPFLRLCCQRPRDTTGVNLVPGEKYCLEEALY